MTGLEPATLGLTGRCANQLRYMVKCQENIVLFSKSVKIFTIIFRLQFKISFTTIIIPNQDLMPVNRRLCMNGPLIIQGVIEIGISLITGLFVFFLSFKVFALLTREIDEITEIKQKNIAVSLLATTFVFSIMFLVRSSIGPAMDTIGNQITAANATAGLVVQASVRMFIYFVFSAFFAFIILWLAIKFFMFLTADIDEMEEIKNNNLAIAIVIGTLIISMAILLQHPLSVLLDGLVPAPRLAGVATKEPVINLTVFIGGLIELGITILAALFIFFFSFKVFSMLTKNIDEVQELKKNNIAVAILSASFIFGIMLIIKAAITPANEALGHAIANNDIVISQIIWTLVRIVLFFIGSAVFAFIALWLAMKAFMFLTTNLDEMEEIKNNNIAVAIIIAILVISAAFLLEHGVTQLLNGLIVTPKVEGGMLTLPR
jgi:uncharacterized membrane protein YjfL (UPF0719 family)